MRHVRNTNSESDLILMVSKGSRHHTHEFMCSTSFVLQEESMCHRISLLLAGLQLLAQGVQ